MSEVWNLQRLTFNSHSLGGWWPPLTISVEKSHSLQMARPRIYCTMKKKEEYAPPSRSLHPLPHLPI